MLYFHRIGVSKGIDANKTSNQKSVLFVTVGIV